MTQWSKVGSAAWFALPSILPVAVIAILLNILIPKDKEAEPFRAE